MCFFAEDLVEVVVRPGLPGDLRAGTIPSRSRSCGPGREGPWPRTFGTAAASLKAETLTTAAMVKKRSAANTAVSEAAVKPERASTRSNGRISTRNSAKSSPDPKVRREPFKTTLTLPNFKSVAFVCSLCGHTHGVCGQCGKEADYGKYIFSLSLMGIATFLAKIEDNQDICQY